MFDLTRFTQLATSIDNRRVRFHRMHAMGIAGALVACAALASGWAIAGLAAFVASLTPLIFASR